MNSTRRRFIKLSLAAAVGSSIGFLGCSRKKQSGMLTLVHFNDVHTHAAESETAIGYPKISTFIKQTKAGNKNTIVLDAGDTFQGTPFGMIGKGENMKNVLNTMEIDAMVLGNHDFNLGKQRLTELAKNINFPVLAANMKPDSGKFMEPYTIKDINGWKVGIIGITTPQCKTPADPDLLEDLKYYDAIEEGQKLVNELRPKVDILIALLHLGLTDTTGITSELFAETIIGVDVIIDGHSHTVLEEGKVVNGTLIAQAGDYGRYVGVVDLTVTEGKVTDAKARLVSKADMAGITPDSETEKVVNDAVAKNEEYLNTVVGSSMVALISPRNTVRTSETNLGNMVTDAIRKACGTEIAVCIGGALNNEAQPGSITRKTLYSLVTRNEAIYTHTIYGGDLLQALEKSVSLYPTPSAAFLQVSGVTFSFDPDKEPMDRVFNIKVGDEAFDTDAYYSFARCIIAYEPSDKSEKDLKRYGELLPIVENYISNNSPVSPKIEGRIRIGKK